MVFCLPGSTGKQKTFRSQPKHLLPNSLGFVENQHSLILHKNSLLCALRVSNEPPFFRGEWVVKDGLTIIAFYVFCQQNTLDYFERPMRAKPNVRMSTPAIRALHDPSFNRTTPITAPKRAPTCRKATT
jgi:hypothetical protein